MNINKYVLHVLSIKLIDKLYFSFSIRTPGFPHFYYMLGANLGLLFYGEVSVMETPETPMMQFQKGFYINESKNSLLIITLKVFLVILIQLRMRLLNCNRVY